MQNDTIRVQGLLRITQSGKQHPNLQIRRKTQLIGGWRFDIGSRPSVVVVLTQGSLRDNRAIKIRREYDTEPKFGMIIIV